MKIIVTRASDYDVAHVEIMEFNTIEELLTFSEKTGYSLILHSRTTSIYRQPQIEIYDEWIE